MNIVVTGANGFVGRAVCAELTARGHHVRGIVRTQSGRAAEGSEIVRVADIGKDTDWREALGGGMDVIIHLAARVHVMHDDAANPLEEFRNVNTEGTEQLARSSAAMGVKRFVYVSTIKVNGEKTSGEQRFSASDRADPQDPYAVSKWEAEQALLRISGETGMEVVIVRPPLIYGPDVKGNFFKLLQVVGKGIPLPLAQVRNARSMLYLGNLSDILSCCAVHPSAAGKTFLLRDGEDISTPELIRLLSAGAGKRARLFPMPIWVLRLFATLTGKVAALDRLTESLRIDDEPIRRDLGWKPRFSVQQAVKDTSAWYMLRVFNQE